MNICKLSLIIGRKHERKLKKGIYFWGNWNERNYNENDYLVYYYFYTTPLKMAATSVDKYNSATTL